jgi:hypothetical protein
LGDRRHPADIIKKTRRADIRGAYRRSARNEDARMLNGLTPDEEVALYRRLEEYRLEHRALDQAIARLDDDPTMDQLQLRRLKKRKLVLKDVIAHIERQLIPDESA